MTGLLFLGFLIGMRHALEADHLAAVASLATRAHSVAGAVSHGIGWGIGHTITLFIVGSLVIFLDVALSETLAHALELAVGIMLVILGADVLRRVLRERAQAHVHSRADATTPCHPHARQRETPHALRRPVHPRETRLPVRAVAIGLMHGMAGSAALILLTLGSVDSALFGLGYLALFGLGSIVGMAVVSAIIAVPLRRCASGMRWMHNTLTGAVGALTVGIGLMVLIDVGRAAIFDA